MDHQWGCAGERVKIETIRDYAGIKLPRPLRAASGYRLYARERIDRLSFIGRGREIGLRLGRIRELEFSIDAGQPCASADRHRARDRGPDACTSNSSASPTAVAVLTSAPARSSKAWTAITKADRRATPPSSLENPPSSALSRSANGRSRTQAAARDQSRAQVHLTACTPLTQWIEKRGKAG